MRPPTRRTRSRDGASVGAGPPNPWSDSSQRLVSRCELPHPLQGRPCRRHFALPRQATAATLPDNTQVNQATGTLQVLHCHNWHSITQASGITQHRHQPSKENNLLPSSVVLAKLQAGRHCRVSARRSDACRQWGETLRGSSKFQRADMRNSVRTQLEPPFDLVRRYRSLDSTPSGKSMMQPSGGPKKGSWAPLAPSASQRSWQVVVGRGAGCVEEPEGVDLLPGNEREPCPLAAASFDLRARPQCTVAWCGVVPAHCEPRFHARSVDPCQNLAPLVRTCWSAQCPARTRSFLHAAPKLAPVLVHLLVLPLAIIVFSADA